MALRKTCKPGIFGIGLNFEKLSNTFFLKQKIKSLISCLEREPIYIKPLIRNLQAMLLFKMDFGKIKACSMLEELIKEYPNDLNILADLIYVYQNMYPEKDSDRYKARLELRKDRPLLQAQSILFQAYVLTYDLQDGYITSPKDLLKHSRRQLDIEGRDLEQVNKGKDMTKKAYKMISKKPYDRQIDACEISVEKFKKGIKMLKYLNRSQKEILFWKHHLGVARAHLDKWRKQRGDDTHSRSRNCSKMLEAHFDVIENLPLIEHLEEPLKKCVAKSCIYFAHFYWTQRNCIDRADLPERIKRPDLDSLWRKAMSICPNDPKILRRCGLYLADVNRNYLEAIKLYDRSISLNPDKDINWLTYAFRMQAYYFYSLQLMINRSDKDQINKYLKLAYSDGKQCLQSYKCRVFYMRRMAEICFQRAMPDKLGVSFRCQHINFINEALETVCQALNKEKLTEDKIYSDLGRYYPYIGKYRKAVDSLKTALKLGEWSKKFPYVFSNLCKCFVAYYERENDKKLLSEFHLMLKEAKKRCCDKWVKDAMDMMHQHNPKMLIDYTQNMIEWDLRRDMLIDEAKSFNKYSPESIRICRNLGEQFETKLQERNDQESDIDGPTEIQKSQSPENFQYDFFVSHTEKEKDWVNCMLQPQLEQLGEEIKFKGFIPSRDFVLGEQVIDSMVKGISQSCKLLIVLTPNYLEDKWQKFVSDTMIFSVIETNVKEKTIIPIILKECDIPVKLKSFTPIFFTKENNWDRLRRSIVIEMDSDET